MPIPLDTVIAAGNTAYNAISHYVNQVCHYIGVPIVRGGVHPTESMHSAWRRVMDMVSDYRGGQGEQHGIHHASTSNSSESTPSSDQNHQAVNQNTVEDLIQKLRQKHKRSMRPRLIPCSIGQRMMPICLRRRIRPT